MKQEKGTKNFKDLIMWQKGMMIAKRTYDMAASMPANEKYGITSQICRAAVSVPSNIAEGYSHTSNKNTKIFLEMALGSCYELETQLLIMAERNWIPEDKVTSILRMVTEEQRMLNSYISKIKIGLTQSNH
ncbi:MAG: four helix bundle protein [Flavobacteriales bacterium]|nr:four helix bundle protein [Flavobacteriales bacterium]